MAKIDLLWSQPHWRAHSLPIFDALPRDVRGSIREYANMEIKEGRIALVGGWDDVARLRGKRKMIYVEHGAGQSYAGSDDRRAGLAGYSASGGFHHEGVIGFIAPSETVAKRWTTAPAIAVGCPKLDRWVGVGADPLHVCFAFHWPCPVAPEAGTAFWHYERWLPRVAERLRNAGGVAYGHAHPRWKGNLDSRLRNAGLRILSSEEDVFSTCGALVVDNSSLGAEFMALDRPVIWLNAPEYRRDVFHGGRFWDWTIGALTVDDGPSLVKLDLAEHLDTDPLADERRRLVPDIYSFTDGSSSRRAAEFVTALARAS